MLGFESLAAQGFPVELIDRLDPSEPPTEPLMADLAGNSFAITVVLAVLTALRCTLEKPEPACAEPDLQAVCDLFRD